MKEEIEKLLKATKREGIEDLCTWMEASGFYTAPASSLYHSVEEGGLAQHSMNVMDCARSIAIALQGKKWWGSNKDSVTICALLHDLGKCGDYQKPFYKENILKSTGKRSEKKPYERNKDLPNIPHAFRSAIIVNRFIDLTEDEEYAIMYHDGLYDRETGGMSVVPGHETPLLLILHWADMWASKILEKGVSADDQS